MKHLLAFVLIAACSAPVCAQESAADWVKKLSSGSYPEREKAARMLEQLGKDAIPALRAALTNADLESQRRALQTMDRIEDKLLCDDLIKPSLVRLRFQNQSAQEALREVETRFGLTAARAVTRQHLVDFDSGEVPYWRAWQLFCDAASLKEADRIQFARKLTIVTKLEPAFERGLDYPHSGFRSGRIEFADAPPSNSYATDDRHSIRVKACLRHIDRDYEKNVPWAIFAVELRPESRLDIISIPTVEITKIVDTRGKDIAIDMARIVPDAARPEIDLFLRSHAGEIQFGGLLHLKAIRWPHQDRLVKDLHGKVRVNASVRAPLIEVSDVLKAAGKETRAFNGITLKVLDTELSDEGGPVLRLRFANLASLTPQTPEEQTIRIRPGVIAVRGVMDIALERLELVSAGGQKGKLVRSRYEPSADGKSYEAVVQFAMPTAETERMTLMLTKAAKTVTLEMPFHMRDVPAPVAEGK
jgi:hypothetical protein